MGFGVEGLGFGFVVWGLGFGSWGPGFGVWGLGFGLGVWGLGFGVWGLGFGVWGLGFGVLILGFGCCGSGFRLQGSGFRVRGLGVTPCVTRRCSGRLDPSDICQGDRVTSPSKQGLCESGQRGPARQTGRGAREGSSPRGVAPRGVVAADAGPCLCPVSRGLGEVQICPLADQNPH